MEIIIMNKHEAYPEKLTFESCAAVEPRLRKIEERILKLKRAHFEITGNQRLHGHNGENVWIGLEGTKIGIADQIEACVGRFSNNPFEFLRSDEAHQVCVKYLSELFQRHENYPYAVEGMEWWNKHLWGEWKREYIG